MASLRITPSWEPTSENVEALPPPIRKYVRGLEEQVDLLAARVKELCQDGYYAEISDLLRAEGARLERELAETREESDVNARSSLDTNVEVAALRVRLGEAEFLVRNASPHRSLGIAEREDWLRRWVAFSRSPASGGPAPACTCTHDPKLPHEPWCAVYEVAGHGSVKP